ncbi:hypothetical protein ACFW0I_36495 [[Kitasatospora] papulosa]|uniref:hypothetical protein n=1 Tax=[Kitasatospora] papulosa TaxID=1464011 RepID=UPI0036756F39
MTAPRREPTEPTTLDLHEQWTASRLDSSVEELSDLLGAFFMTTEDPDSPPAVST